MADNCWEKYLEKVAVSVKLAYIKQKAKSGCTVAPNMGS
jgi:hypothetical protein